MTMRMHSVAALLCGVAISVSAALAQDSNKTPPNPLSPVSGILSAVTNAPDGWTPNLDGSYRQAASNIVCPKRFITFTLNNVTGPAADNANILGVCRYTDGEGRNGAIRIRKYAEGGNTDYSTATNDKQLMATDGSAPPMLMRHSVDRKTGASRLTVTTVRNGYLVDCSVAQIEHSIPRGDFPLYCTTIPTAAAPTAGVTTSP